MAIQEESFDGNPRICVVLGGQTFIGKSLVSMLLKSDNWIVRVADCSPSPSSDSNHQNSLLYDAISSGRASYYQVNVRDKSQIHRAIEGSTIVFYTDTTDLSLNDAYLQYMTIVQGTKNVISACRECKVKRLIYTSSADFVIDGLHDICDGDESLQYPWKFKDVLSDFKAQAEALVLFSNSSDGLLTCALRPSFAFGPGDTNLIPFLLTPARVGFEKCIVGNGENLCDFTYVDNIAHANICAEEALRSRMASVAGKAFFITNVEPMKFWDFVCLVVEGVGYKRPKFRFPVKLVRRLFVITNSLVGMLGEQRNVESAYTPILHAMSRTRTFSCFKAQNDIGYSPVVSLKEGIALTTKSFLHSNEDSSNSGYADFGEQTKTEKLLGSGRVASILLWRDEKKTFTYFVVLFLFLEWFLLSGRTFISSVSQLLLLLTVFLYGIGKLPSPLFNLSVRRMQPSDFEVSETMVKDLVVSSASTWNQSVRMLRAFAHGDNWNTFFKVTTSLYLIKLLLSLPISTLIRTAIVFAFTLFFVYEQHEDEIRFVTKVASIGIKNTKGLLLRKLPASVASFLKSYQIMGFEEVGIIDVNDQTH